MRIFAFTFILLIAYQAILTLTGAAPGLGRDNYETNSITSENYRYLPKTPEVLIVGSSKTNFFNYDCLGHDIFHFGYGGQGALTGLEILTRSKSLPKLILVEVGDTLQWPADAHCVQVASADFEIGDVLSSLQHRYQPVAVILGFYNKYFPREVPSSETQRYLIALQHEQLSVPLREGPRAELLSNCDRAIELMNLLKNRGARIVRFDPPVESDVANSRFVSESRNLVNNRFEAAGFPCLTSSAGNWHTRDGTHLMPESGKIYSLWLRKHIDRLLSENPSGER